MLDYDLEEDLEQSPSRAPSRKNSNDMEVENFESGNKNSASSKESKDSLSDKNDDTLPGFHDTTFQPWDSSAFVALTATYLLSAFYFAQDETKERGVQVDLPAWTKMADLVEDFSCVRPIFKKVFLDGGWKVSFWSYTYPHWTPKDGMW